MKYSHNGPKTGSSYLYELQASRGYRLSEVSFHYDLRLFEQNLTWEIWGSHGDVCEDMTIFWHMSLYSLVYRVYILCCRGACCLNHHLFQWQRQQDLLKHKYSNRRLHVVISQRTTNLRNPRLEASVYHETSLIVILQILFSQAPINYLCKRCVIISDVLFLEVLYHISH
jgi:hypothetical protein